MIWGFNVPTLFHDAHELINLPLQKTQWTFEPLCFTPSQKTDKALENKEPLAFFYALGLWPKTVASEPTTFSIIYEKGPPSHFIGKIIASWKGIPHRIVIEGPKTPSTKLPLDELKSCILYFNQQDTLWNQTCYQFRYELFSRHQEFLSQTHAKIQHIQWLEIINPYIDPLELPKGIWIQSSNASQIQDKVILFSLFGKSQSFLLERKRSEEGAAVFHAFQSMIASTRMVHDIADLRLWINQALSQTQLVEEKKLPITQQLESLLTTQKLLLSKVSVDPASFESYYHLAGVTSMIIRKLHFLLKTQDAAYEKAPSLETLKETLKTAIRFAQDLNAQDTRMLQLEKIWQECYSLF